MIPCLHCHEPVMTRLVLFTGVVMAIVVKMLKKNRQKVTEYTM